MTAALRLPGVQWDGSAGHLQLDKHWVGLGWLLSSCGQDKGRSQELEDTLGWAGWPDPLQFGAGLVPGDVDHQRRHADGGGADDEPGHWADQRPPPQLPGLSQLQVGSERGGSHLTSDLSRCHFLCQCVDLIELETRGCQFVDWANCDYTCDCQCQDSCPDQPYTCNATLPQDIKVTKK